MDLVNTKCIYVFGRQNQNRLQDFSFLDSTMNPTKTDTIMWHKHMHHK